MAIVQFTSLLSHTRGRRRGQGPGAERGVGSDALSHLEADDVGHPNEAATPLSGAWPGVIHRRDRLQLTGQLDDLDDVAASTTLTQP